MIKEASPVPQGRYVPATRYENLIFTAGMTPRRDGVLLQKGPVLPQEPVEHYREAVRQAAKNALTAASNMLREGEHIARLLSITVYISAPADYTTHPKLADLASEYFCEELGEAGIGSRAAIGVASLPENAPVELSIVAVAGR